MATNILALPELSMPCSIESNMDWIDSIVFFDAAGNAVALDGIDFHLQVRVSAELPDVLVDASTDNGLLQILSSGFSVSLASPGSGYQLGDVVYLAGGVAVAPASVRVTALSVISFGRLSSQVVNSDGSGITGQGHYAGEVMSLLPGPSTVAAGSASPAIVVIDTVDQYGNILTYHVQSGGSYSSPPTSGVFLAPVVAGHAAQALFVGPITYAIAAVEQVDGGIYTTPPTSPVSQKSSTGSGSGATFSLAQVNNALAILIPADALVHPLIEAAGVYQIQAMADGYTQNIASGAMTVTQGIVR